MLKTDESMLSVKFESDNSVSISLTPTQTTLSISKYEEWLSQNGYDVNKVKLITNLIFLNMAPLHSKKFGDFLYFFAISRLTKDGDK